MTTNPQQAWAAVSRTQAQAFLNSLWPPAGEFCHLHSHTRTYFEALLGTVPNTIGVSDGLPELAQLLRAIADQLDAGGVLMTRSDGRIIRVTITAVATPPQQDGGGDG